MPSYVTILQMSSLGLFDSKTTNNSVMEYFSDRSD